MMAGGERGEAGGGEPTPFAEVMRNEGMMAPAALSDSMNAALRGGPQDGGDGDGLREAQEAALSADDLLRAAENLLDKVLANQCETRDSALDLLTVDALVTRAMEVAARDPQSLAEFPELAMKRIAAK